jgi:N-acetylmuramoyl-L-alanine amidase
VLDPGHNGGSDQAAEDNKLVPAGYGRTKPCNTTGTSTDAGYAEHAFTWDVANRAATILRRHGVRVLMTRTSDAGIGPCVNVRAAIESTPGVAAAIAIHADGGPADGHGFHICEDSRTPQGASAATVAKSHTLSLDMRSALQTGSGLTRSTYIGAGTAFYPRDDLTGLNLSTNPTTFLELGNMRNSGDAALQSSASGRARIASAVAAGILTYLGL